MLRQTHKDGRAACVGELHSFHMYVRQDAFLRPAQRSTRCGVQNMQEGACIVKITCVSFHHCLCLFLQKSLGIDVVCFDVQQYLALCRQYMYF